MSAVPSVIGGQNGQDVQVGNNAGWYLRFYTETAPDAETEVIAVGSDDYYAAIDASLSSGLDGGDFHFTIEGMTDSHYGSLHDKWSKPPLSNLYVDLYLYWRDVGSITNRLTSAFDVSFGAPPSSALVARLIVTSLSRRVGTRRYEAVIDARDRVYDALTSSKRLDPMPPADDAVQLAKSIAAKLIGTESRVRAYPDTSAADGDAVPQAEHKANGNALKALEFLETAMSAQSKRTGRGMYLIRDGKLYIGPERPIPVSGIVTTLDDAHGLVHVETSGVSISASEIAGDGRVKSRVQYALLAKGRPDIKPGDTVTFQDPFGADESVQSATSAPLSFGRALAGLGQSFTGGASSAGTTVTIYVSSVHHTQSRSEGFATKVAGVRIDKNDIWDVWAPKIGTTGADPAATASAEVADAIRDLFGDDQETMTIGEVRAANVAGQDEPPSQTVDVWSGLVASDGAPRGARRLPIDRDARARLTGVPYATPFAWGKCGLVLPRYPGTRVLLAHASGAMDDPIDVGSVWESGHGPDSRAGDWWLILPAAVDVQKRQSSTDDDAPQEPSEKATNDLIDADGTRIIEVGRLTVRIMGDNLNPPGTRPSPPTDSKEQITIEHQNGSRITIKDSGEVVIHAEGDLTLSAKNTMTLSANSVQVKVKQTMDIGDQ